MSRRSWVWGSDPCPCGMEVVSQEIFSKVPRSLEQMRHCCKQPGSWTDDVISSLLARGGPSPGAEAGGDLTVTDRDHKHRPCVIVKFHRFGLLDSRTLLWVLLQSLQFCLMFQLSEVLGFRIRQIQFTSLAFVNSPSWEEENLRMNYFSPIYCPRGCVKQN